MTKERAKELLALVRWQSGGCLCNGASKPPHQPETPAERTEIMAAWNANPNGSSSYASTLYTMAR